jgi:hypothetical protein
MRAIKHENKRTQKIEALSTYQLGLFDHILTFVSINY